MGVRLLACFLSLFCLVGCSRHGTGAHQSAAPELTAHGPPSGLPTLAPMLAKASPAVVSISVQGEELKPNPFAQDPLLGQLFHVPSGPLVERFQAAGSGVIIDAKNGYVSTAYHVIKNAHQILVTLSDRREFKATVIGADPQTDIAVLKIPGRNLISMPLGISRDLKVGDYVVAIGNPFGLGQTATFGIISALGKSGLGIDDYEDFIQTDASINPGNSGGALVNIAGQLIGLNTAILSQSGGNIGVGFAIPVDMVRSVTQDLIRFSP